ncbi:MAG TPA: alpha/beta fold hydrolase [Candidatus Acidoferrales bacterium]|nr:alpha/beta fold hydrolase [Candidatus Acidoferrales bacterium]
MIPLAAAVAGAVLGPTVLHPHRDALSREELNDARAGFSMVGAVPQDVTVRASDGAVLRGWKVPAPHPKGAWVLLLHGRSHNRTAMLPYAKLLLNAGYGVVMMDARNQGASGGSMSTYGLLERQDSRVIVDHLESSEGASHIFALGESMGAAVALQDGSDDPRIEAVVAEGAFRNLREVTFDYAGLQLSATLGKTLFRPTAIVADFEAQHEGGFRFEDVSPERAVAARSFPILLICGLSDTKIPCRHSEAIYAHAIGPKQLWEVPGAGHQKAIVVAPEEFRRRVLDFFASAGH